MMKIEIQETGGSVVLKVEGRLAGPFAAELENCWNVARASHPRGAVSVDLKHVTCVDRAGRLLLQSMYREGVPLLRAGLAVQDILEQIREQPECRH
jgi:anti-anti-sigma regulatory factor